MAVESGNYPTNRDVVSLLQGLEALRVGNKNGLRESQIYAITEEGKAVGEINKHFFILATLIIPIESSLIALKDLREILVPADRHVLAQSLIFLFLSIIFGFIHMRSDVKFFRRGIKSTNKKLKLWATTSFWPGHVEKAIEYIDEYNKILKRVAKITASEKEENTLMWLILQGGFLLLGIVPVILIALRILLVN